MKKQTAPKKAQKSGKPQKRAVPNEKTPDGDRRAFEQLLDDAILGPRGQKGG